MVYCYFFGVFAIFANYCFRVFFHLRVILYVAKTTKQNRDRAILKPTF